MKIRAKLILSLLACGLLPLLTVSVANYFTAAASLEGMSAEAKKDFEILATNQLVSVRDVKKSQIEDYFETIYNQMVTFSESPNVVNAMHDFSRAFKEFGTDAQIDPTQIPVLRSELAGYYDRQFGEEYRKQNSGKSANTSSLLSQVDDESVLLQHSYIVKNSNPLGSKHLLDKGSDDSAYSKIHGSVHPILRNYLEKFGYYDIFLVDIESGKIVYSVFKELDYGTSLKSGPYAGTNIGRAFNQAAASTAPGKAFLVDFECYTPSYEAPASFIASPIFDGDKKIGVAIFQMPLGRINEIMNQRNGMGETGETYIVGGDHLLRCDTFRDSKNFSIASSFREKKKFDSGAVSEGLAGKSGSGIFQNYLGEEVLSAYTPVELHGNTWVVVSEAATGECLHTVKELNTATSSAKSSLVMWGLSIFGFSALAIGVVGYITTRAITKPLNGTIAALKDIAEGEGDLTKRLDQNRSDELGTLAFWFNKFVVRIQDVVKQISVNSTTLSQASLDLSAVATQLAQGTNETKSQSATVSSAAEEMSINMKNMAGTTEEMSRNMQAVATSIDEMNSTINEIARNAEKSATVASQAAKLVDASNDRISHLGNAADEIGKVIEVIQDIAEQTNLLALNATIEAARAGEAGKGFAVVATEVKELAKQTAAATDDIRHRIEMMQASTGEAIHSIRAISEVIQNVNEVARTIASAVEEQSITTKQIAGNVAHSASAAEVVARSVSESAQASSEITVSVGRVDQVLLQTSSSATQSRDAGEKLSLLANQMQQLVRQFRIEDGSSNLAG